MFDINQQSFEEMKKRVVAEVERPIVNDMVKHYRSENITDAIIVQVRNKVVKEIKKEISEQVINNRKIDDLLNKSEHFAESAINAKINNTINAKVDTLISRLKAQADEVRELEKAIFTDYRNGMDLHDIAKKNDCTYKRVVLTLNKEMR